jgi:hypothetical protein
MSSVEQISIAGVMAVLAQRLPVGVSACEYQLAFDSDISMPIIRVAMILDSIDWDDRAIQACAAGTDAAWDTLTPYGYVPDVICRTEAEQTDARSEEKWERVNVDC